MSDKSATIEKENRTVSTAILIASVHHPHFYRYYPSHLARPTPSNHVSLYVSVNGTGEIRGSATNSWCPRFAEPNSPPLDEEEGTTRSEEQGEPNWKPSCLGCPPSCSNEGTVLRRLGRTSSSRVTHALWDVTWQSWNREGVE